jgi:arsenate reductase
MAEGLLRHMAGDRYEVFSAGTHPRGIHPLTVEVLREAGVDISTQTSKDLNPYIGQSFDYVITVCDRAKQACPVFSGSVPIHWNLEDPADATGPKEAQLKTFRRIREEIRNRLRLFLSGNKD